MKIPSEKGEKKNFKGKIMIQEFVFPDFLFPSDGVFQYLATWGKIYGFELLEGVKISPKFGILRERNPINALNHREGLLQDFREIGNFFP